jgi:hypothetical protein
MALLQNPSVTLDHNMRVAENSVIYVDRSKKICHPQRLGHSTYVNDGIFQRPHFVILRHACFLKQCIGQIAKPVADVCAPHSR